MRKLKRGASACVLLAMCLTVLGAGGDAAELSELNINEAKTDVSSWSLASSEIIRGSSGLDGLKDGGSCTELCALGISSEMGADAFGYCSEFDSVCLDSGLRTDLGASNDAGCWEVCARTADCGVCSCETVSALSEGVKIGSRIYELLFGSEECAAPVKVGLGGEIFGVKLRQSRVTVQDAKGIPALSRGDVIHSINGTKVSSVTECASLIARSGGNSVTINASRNGVPITIEVKPTMSDGTWTLGITLRDGAMGIGTMTFYDPQTGFFGGLGHPICDADGQTPTEMKSGDVTGALLGGIRRGESGKPGELSGILTGEKRGTLTSNNECGVYGYLDGVPMPERLVEIGTKNQIHEGEATVVSTLKNGKSAEYKIKIYDIDKTASGSKCFRIKVTDDVLIALTGGIVRGMSGSPIIQDGKLVGAVTHVMVADPTEGYGIFIENMLNAAQNQTIPKAA